MAAGMTRILPLLAFAGLLLIAGCAARPINPPITEHSPGEGYTIAARLKYAREPENLVILAFSGAERAPPHSHMAF